MRRETITLTASDLEKAEEFAELRFGDKGSKELYNQRGNFKKQDIVIGALAEIGAYKLLRKYNIKVNKPDFTIHEKKSFDADLTNGKKFFHVKGQGVSSALKYGESWLFQRSDKIVKAPMTNHYVIPCVVDEIRRCVYIYGIISTSALHNHECFGECRVPRFRHTKLALYRDFLANVSDTGRWGILWGKRRG